MEMGTSGSGYPEKALAIYESCIAPILGAFKQADSSDGLWIESCDPGDTSVARFRLFPGSLYLLWVEALGVKPHDCHARVAAAIECLHNASLHHDDAIDGHSSRRGVTTALAQHGFAAPVLAGDGLVGIGLRLLGTAPDLDCRLIVEYLGTAWHRMTQGQAMDEPAAWKSVPTEKHEQHWELMTRSKLALGNVAAPLASATVGRRDIVKSVAQLHERFSVASQIMNDIGDLEGWEGFHTIGPSTRKRCEEACRKPTIATIWSRASEDEVGGMALGRRALQQVSLLTSEALKELSGFSLQSPAADTLQDFFIRPLREMERVARGHTPC